MCEIRGIFSGRTLKQVRRKPLGQEAGLSVEMREDTRETSTSPTATRVMNASQVKEALNKLDKADGDARRTALNSLKQCVEAMDAASVPRLIAQVSEAKDTSRAYAISLYEDVARVHGKLMIPHIPRVMTTITKTLSSSGSSPQLQQACAKVISAIAKHVIDERSPTQASDVLKDLCNPLLDVLTGKLEPLAAGAAICLETLVESDKWNFASSAVVKDLCLKTTVALAEKRTRTVAHMQLARSLAASNSSLLASYGVTLLRSGVDVLRSSATSTSWQQRASAARLLTAVLPTVDRATLAEELNTTVQVLDNCKHDRMSNVRWAVKEALKTAREVLSEENSRRSSDGDELLLRMNASLEPSSSSPGRSSSLGGVSSDDLLSPPTLPRTAKSYHRGSPVSPVIPLTPSATSVSSRSQVAAATALASGEVPVRSPLRITRKENLRSHDPDAQTRTKTGTRQSDLSPSKPPTTVGAALQHSLDSGMHNLGGDFLAEEEDSFLHTPPRTDSGRESSEPLGMKSSRAGDVKDSPTNSGASRSYHGVLNGSTMKHVFELKGPALRSSPRTNEDENVAAVLSLSKRSNSGGKEASNGPLGSPLRTGASLQLSSFEDPLSPQNAQPLLGAEDFLPFSTPRQLVRSLQDSFTSTQPRPSPASYAEHDLARVSRDEGDFADRMGTDMDLGTPTSTSTGWSVCTNPIASEESLNVESDDSDHEQQRASWKTMTLCLLPPTSPTAPAPHTPPGQEMDNPDHNDGLVHRLHHPSSAADSLMQPQGISQAGNTSRSPCGENTVELKPESSNVVDINRLSLGEGSHATLQCGCTALSSIGNGVDKWCCSDAQSQGREHENGVVTTFEVTADSDGGGDSSAATVSVVAVSFEKDSSEIVEVELSETKAIRTGWRERLRRAFFSWQVCVVIGSISVAFFLSKVVFPSDPRFTGYLVPT